MKKTFTVVSRNGINGAIRYLERPHIVISITDEIKHKVKINQTAFTKGIIHLYFHDVDEKFIGPEKFKPFSGEQARAILGFMKDYEDEVEFVLCQCDAGISRSAGVAAALSKIYNDEDEMYFKNYIPNSLVRRLILEENFVS